VICPTLASRRPAQLARLHHRAWLKYVEKPHWTLRPDRANLCTGTPIWPSRHGQTCPGEPLLHQPVFTLVQPNWTPEKNGQPKVNMEEECISRGSDLSVGAVVYNSDHYNLDHLKTATANCADRSSKAAPWHAKSPQPITRRPARAARSSSTVVPPS